MHVVRHAPKLMSCSYNRNNLCFIPCHHVMGVCAGVYVHLQEVNTAAFTKNWGIIITTSFVLVDGIVENSDAFEVYKVDSVVKDLPSGDNVGQDAAAAQGTIV